MAQVVALVSTAYENRRLFEQIQARVQREQTLREITANVRGSMDPDTIMRTAVRELGAILGRQTFVRLGNVEQLAQEPPEMDGNGQKGIPKGSPLGGNLAHDDPEQPLKPRGRQSTPGGGK